MSKRVSLVLSLTLTLLLLVGLSAPRADASPEPNPGPGAANAVAKPAVKVQPAIYTPTTYTPTSLRPQIVKPKMPAPKLAASFGFQGAAGLPKLAPVRPVVVPRELPESRSGTVARSARDLSGFRGFGGALAKPAVRAKLTRPAPPVEGMQTVRAKSGCADGTCGASTSSDGVTWFEKSEERVVSSRFVPLGANLDGSSGPRKPVDGYNPTNPDNAPYTKHYNVCCTPNCNTCDSCDTCSSCDDCCSCRPCETRCVPRVRRYYRPVYRYRPVVYARPACGWGWGWGRPYWGGWRGYGWGGGWGGWGWGGCW